MIRQHVLIRTPILISAMLLLAGWPAISGRVAGANSPLQGRFGAKQQALRTRLLAKEGRNGAAIRDNLVRCAASKSYVLDLMQHELIRVVGASNLDQLAEREKGRAFLTCFMADASWVGMFLTSGPLGKDPARNLGLLYEIWRRDPACTKTRHEKTLATAVALEYGRHNWPLERAWTRYSFYRDSRREERLHPVYDTLDTWEKRWLTGRGFSMHGGDASQVWLRDNVKLPIQRYTGACWQLAYRGYNCFGDTVQSWTYYFPFQGSFPSFTEMTRFVGGVCGRLSGYGAAAAVANGIPATTMGEPGHCAYAVRLARGKWTPAYTLSWKRGVHVNLYGPSWQTLVFTDRMMSAERAWRKATVHLWQARLHLSASDHSARSDPAVLAAYLLATKAQAINLAAWREFGAWLAARDDVSAKTWKQFHDGVLAGLAKDFPELAWSLISTYAYPALTKGADPKKKAALFLRFHKALDTWGAGRWPVEKMFAAQWKFFGDDDDAAFTFFKAVFAVQRSSKTYLGPLLTWGFNRFGKTPELRRRFFKTIAGAIKGSTAGKVDSNAILAMASSALSAAENTQDASMYRTVGHMIDQAAPPVKELAPAEFRGELLSEGAMATFSSISKRWDKSTWRHWFLGSRRPGFFHSDEVEDPRVDLVLPHYGDLSGMVIVNRATHRERAIPLHVSVSTDGKSWREIAVLSRAEAQWRIDLKGKKVRAKYIRVMKKGKGFLHLQNIRVYGRRSS